MPKKKPGQSNAENQTLTPNTVLVTHKNPYGSGLRDRSV